MPQDSAIYGVARIRTNEKRLIGREKMSRLAELGAHEVMRQLTEQGYGSMPDAAPGDGEAMIEAELAAARALVREVSIDPGETDIYLMAADIHNLKLLLKLRLTGSREEPSLMPGGCFDKKLLAAMVADGEYKGLPDEIQAALDSLELSFIGAAPDPARLSRALDEAYIAYALRRGSAFTKAYYRAMADFDNITAILRMRALKADAPALEGALVSGGDIPKEELMRAYALPSEALGKTLARGPARDAIIKGLEEAERTGRASAMEKARDDYLMSLAARGKNDVDTIAPVIGYLLAKEQEARAVRLILTAKRNGLGDDVINERMRLLYG